MRLRLLPILIVAAGVVLTARVGDLWRGFGTMAQAQTADRGESAETAPRGIPRRAEAAGADTATADNKGQGSRLLDLPTDPLALTDEEIDLLQALAERRRQLELRARQIDQREALLQAAERRIEERVDGLKALQKSIEDLLLQQEEETEDQYKSLVKIYENMKPKDAARILEGLDMAVLLPVIERMKERKIAPILAKMSAERAKAITTELARRRDELTARM